MSSAILWLSFALAAAALAALGWEDMRFRMRGARRVSGVVTGYRSQEEDGTLSYAAMLRFEDEAGRSVEVVDRVFRPTRTPPVGTMVILEHPKGLPQKARVRRPWLQLILYLLLAYMAGIVVLALLGRI